MKESGEANSQPRSPKKADHGWIVKLIQREGPSILRMLWKLLSNEQDVLDAYQDCWCSLAALPHPGDLRSAKAFAYRTATNIAIEMIRRQARRRGHWPAIVAERRNHEETDDEPEDDGVEALRQAIPRLPQHLQNVIVLRDLGKMTYRELSQVLGIEPGTARVYRRQAVVKLAELMNPRSQA